MKPAPLAFWSIPSAVLLPRNRTPEARDRPSRWPWSPVAELLLGPLRVPGLPPRKARIRSSLSPWALVGVALPELELVAVAPVAVELVAVAVALVAVGLGASVVVLVPPAPGGPLDVVRAPR